MQKKSTAFVTCIYIYFFKLNCYYKLSNVSIYVYISICLINTSIPLVGLK